MNRIENSLLLEAYQNNIISQRKLANSLECSLGMINKSINHLKEENLLNEDGTISLKGKQQIEINKPKNAIILAAGLGMRMTPINQDTSKGLLIVHGQKIIENTIQQLHEANIHEIYLVVGFMKEQYEYLIDKFNVHLIVNSKYKETNNCYSLYLARTHLDNTYIIPCDIYIQEKIFKETENHSWYLFQNTIQTNNSYKTTKTGFVELTKNKQKRKQPLGIAYLNHIDSQILKKAFNQIDTASFTYKHYYWENIAFVNHIQFHASTTSLCFEINTFEDLRKLDIHSSSLQSEIIDIITQSLNIDMMEIKNITLAKKGMTNRSFLFETEKEKYIMRIPGEGTRFMLKSNS